MSFFFLWVGTYSSFEWDSGVYFTNGRNIRAAPSKDAEKIGFAEALTKYCVFESEGAWSKILMRDGGSGWAGCSAKSARRDNEEYIRGIGHSSWLLAQRPSMGVMLNP